MNKKYGMVQTLVSALVFFLVSIIALGHGFAEEKTITSSNDIPKWHKVAAIKNIDGESIKWCGKLSIVYFSIPHPEYGKFEGGIEFYDLKTGKSRLITDDPKTSKPFCSADGSVVFWYGSVILDNFKDNAKIKTTATLWGYDTKTNRSWRVAEGNLLNLNGDINLVWASPIDKTILFLGFNQKELANLSIDLPNWRILKISLDSLGGKICRGGDWARDANYFYFNIEPRNIFTGRKKECQMAIYDANGEFQHYVGYIAKPEERYPDETVLIHGGYYMFDRSNNQIIRMDIETGKRRSYQLPKGTDGFDISPKGEIIYWVTSNKGSSIWFASKLGDKPRFLEFGAAPRFSQGGEYIYFYSYVAEEPEVGVEILERE